MDLLMHLIDKNKIDIYDIPIAELTQQYMDYLDKFREFNIEIASEFLVMAATLLYIKSRMMVPKPPMEEEEDEEYEDPRRELVEQILAHLEYRRIKEVSGQLSEMAVREGRYFTRQPTDLPVHRLPPANMEVSLLLKAFRAVFAAKEEPTIPEALVAPEEYNIQDKMEEILSHLTLAGGRLLFSETFHFHTRSEAIVNFLALLELIKLKAINVRQNRVFADIYIVLNPDGAEAVMASG